MMESEAQKTIPTQPAGEPAAVKASSRKVTAKKLIQKEKTESPKKAKDPDQHSGHVLKISVEDGKAAAIELVSKKGDRQSFAVSDDNPGSVSARLALATAALTSGAKLHIRSKPLGGGGLSIASMELRSKR